MSRTYKDRPYKIRFPQERRDDYVVYKEEPWLQTTKVVGYDRETFKTIEEELPFPVWHVTRWEIPGPTTKPKLRRYKESRGYGRYTGAPSWWTRMFMNKPQRHKGRQWERKVLFEDLEETDPPGVSRKPFVYYY
jgi:hypothetical protein